MANGFYAPTMQVMVDGGMKFVTDTYRLLLIDAADYTVDLTNHDFLNDVAAAAREEGPVTIGTRTALSDGIIDGDDVVFTAAAGDPCEALICYNDTPATEGAKHLLFYIDTATGLPVTLNGGNVTVTWDSGTNRIAKL